MDETKRSLSAAYRVDLTAPAKNPVATQQRSLRSWCQSSWYLVCASSIFGLASAQAHAQAPAPSTAPSGVTTIAPPPAPPTGPVVPPPAVTAPPPAVVVPPPAVIAPPPAVVVPPPAVIAPPPAAEVPPPPPPLVFAPPPPPPLVSAPVPPPAPVAPPPAASPSWTPVFTGSYFTRYELRSGFDDLNIATPTSRQRFLEGDAVYYRARFGIGTGLLDVGNGLKVGLQFTPQTTGVFGNLPNSPATPNTIVDANLGLHEGYARVQGKHARFDAGRFELSYGDTLVVGNLDWNEIGRSFDGARVRLSADATNATLPWVDVFATILDEGRPDFPRNGVNDQLSGIGQGDIYFLGAYGAFGPAITKGLDLDLYSFVRAWGPAKGLRTVSGNLMSPTYNRDNATEATFGARAKQKVKIFDYRTELGVQAGSRPRAAPAANATAPVPEVENIDVLAYHADLELGVSFAEDKYRISLEGLYASGDNANSKNKGEGWDELFPTAHKFLGLSDAFAQGGQKRTNVASGVLHLTAVALKQLTFQIDGHVFARPEKSAQFFNERGFAGGELDIGAVLVLAKGLKMRGTYAVFMPNSELYHDVLPSQAVSKSADPVHWAELELRYDLLP